MGKDRRKRVIDRLFIISLSLRSFSVLSDLAGLGNFVKVTSQSNIPCVLMFSR